MTLPKPLRPIRTATPERGWRRARVAPSLAEVYRTVPVSDGAWWRKILAFAGPGYLVAVGYMDPGNCAESALRHTADVGCRAHGARRHARALSAEQGIPAARSVGRRARRDDRALLSLRDHPREAGLRGDRLGLRAALGDRTESQHAVHRHQHPWRDGDAAQSLFALVDRADAALPGDVRWPPGGSAVRVRRFDHRAHLRALHQCRYSHRLGG